jgi:putative flippase GtrA
MSTDGHEAPAARYDAFDAPAEQMAEGDRGATLDLAGGNALERLAARFAAQRARATRLIRFAIVGASGILVNELAIALFVSGFGFVPIVGYLLATQVSTFWNFILLEVWAFKDSQGRGRRWHRWAMLMLVNNIANVATAPLFILLTNVFGVNYLISNVLTLAVVMLGRFAIADWLWGGSKRHAHGTFAEEALAAVVPEQVAEEAAAANDWPLPALQVAPGPSRARVPAEPVAPAGTPEPEVAERRGVVIEAPFPKTGLARVPTWFLLSGISVIALALRLVGLNRLGFNTDEAVYAGQGASIAGNTRLSAYFPVFRAHPLLFQSFISVLYRFDVTDYGARVLAVAFGVGTVVLVYLCGKELFSRSVGLTAALILAVMPYHVIVSRQVLLDGPMTFFTTLSLFLLARFARTERPAWLAAAAGGLALSFLSKETTIVMVGAAYAFFALAQVRVRFRHFVIAGVVFFICILPYPLSLKFAGQGGTGNHFLTWQLFRRPNHTFSFYFERLPSAIGPLVVIAAAAGVALLWRNRDWPFTLLLTWIAVPAVFFSLWPVKGFQYLLPIAAPIAILAAVALVHLPELVSVRNVNPTVMVAAGVAIVTLTLSFASLHRIEPSSSGQFLAGSGGVPGGRETGHWVDKNVPIGARMLALGPSMSNIIEFYGNRKVYALSVSTNPLHRNPVYEPVSNPDRLIRTNEVQYLVWDSFSASRSKHFSAQLLAYADRYHGRVVYTATVPVKDSSGRSVTKPVIQIIEVRP